MKMEKMKMKMKKREAYVLFEAVDDVGMVKAAVSLSAECELGSLALVS
jgi:hypothetical protein